MIDQAVGMLPGQAPGSLTEAFASAVESGLADLPLPGQGRTAERWAGLADIAMADLSLARLCEGHADALAILAELGASPPRPGSRWGVWAAQPPGPRLTAARTRDGWLLTGTKRYCSGARSCTDALVTAEAPDGPRLFRLSTAALRPVPGSWPATGMAASETLDIQFADITADPVGDPGDYTRRPGFAHGGVGVAACWYGGARAIGQTLLATARRRDIGPHGLAHLGAVDLALTTAWSALATAAAQIDGDPADTRGGARIRALRVRAIVEAAATDVMTRVGRALGAAPLCHDGAHGRRVADLTVYLRQHHAEADLESLGRVVTESGTAW